MPIPQSFQGRLRLPAIAAPMFLCSGPDLVVEACRAGVVGTFPALNQRTSEGFEAWLEEIQQRLDSHKAEHPAPYGVNLIVHKSNPRVDADLKLCVKHKVPLIITSLGAVSELVEAVHSYGGLVFHDVINIRHAEKAAAAGVDGLIAVCAGAGGHAGTMSPFALVSEIRKFFHGTILLSGVMSTGRHIAAAQMMGADLAYIGTRFIATKESMADERFKQMVVDSTASDILYTPAISGVSGNFLKPSIVASGGDPDNMPVNDKGYTSGHARAWKDVWSAGQGVGSIHDIPTMAELVAHMRREYVNAVGTFAADARAYSSPVREAAE
ncbi:nitronate monooxygenase [Variibacter gotjawalensis]|uniref:Nitronate monooxygenase n=1 Tax=Variibacter gotjawalensis TaxID=1333996 RepID=A0A0S3PP38_9BRAD|nr:nitronate monooxygenase family protein [Variibacter gotjawalensis]NIK47975.1 nitronate monooxygenase [Variibacter gotjawalensis]RZS49852.1 nitronate monooxygenase [Variibacter gotjawalensis]BAT57681.1 nitronate monooxygenase [Variibacter gotjawalensis]